MPDAARITDAHTCPIHGGGPIDSGSSSVIVGFLQQARVGDTAICAGGKDVIARGAFNVIIDGAQAARVGDPTVHGGVIVSGLPSVQIGTTPQALTLVRAAQSAAPFCEECEKAKQKSREEVREEDAILGMPSAETVEPFAPDDTSLEPSERPTQYTPTPQQTALAQSPATTPAAMFARENVVRDFYERFKNDGLGQTRADVDLGVGGWPPRPNLHPSGFAIDLKKPLQVISLEAAAQIPSLPPAVYPEGKGLLASSGPMTDAFTNPDKPVQIPGGDPVLIVPDSIRKAIRLV